MRLPQRSLALLAVACATASLWAQPAAEPTQEEMIRQLQPPRTRSLRNLLVEPAAPPQAQAASAAGGGLPAQAAGQAPPQPGMPAQAAAQAPAQPGMPPAHGTGSGVAAATGTAAPALAGPALLPPAVAGGSSQAGGAMQQAAEPPPSLSLLVQFDFDSARVRPESAAVLETLARALQASELAASRFAIEGHTDSRGRADYNQQLSQRRADAVREVLVRHGVAVARLQAIGRGSSEPANPAQPQAAENRRVRIVNLD